MSLAVSRIGYSMNDNTRVVHEKAASVTITEPGGETWRMSSQSTASLRPPRAAPPSNRRCDLNAKPAFFN
jgi:hypothetical protein